MSSDLMIPTDGALAERLRYAQALAASSLLPPAYRKQPANVLVALEHGRALGLDPVTAMQMIHVVEGKPTASSQLIGALVRRAGHRLRVTGDDSHAVAEIVRKDDPEFVFRAEWTMDRARAAGLAGKGPWKAYPAAMLKARAITEVARDACPEALSGVAYTPEELGDMTTELSGPVGNVMPATVPVAALSVPDEVLVDDQIRPAQVKVLSALLVDLGFTDRKAKLTMLGHILGRDVAQPADLTTIEGDMAEQVLRRTLEEFADRTEPLPADFHDLLFTVCEVLDRIVDELAAGEVAG